MRISWQDSLCRAEKNLLKEPPSARRPETLVSKGSREHPHAQDKRSSLRSKFLKETCMHQNENWLSQSSLTSNWDAQESSLHYSSPASTGHLFSSLKEDAPVSFAKQDFFLGIAVRPATAERHRHKGWYEVPYLSSTSGHIRLIT